MAELENDILFCFCCFWLLGFSKKIFFFINEKTKGFHMRYHSFLHYGWFLQNLGKDFIPTNMHTTVVHILSSRKYSRMRYWHSKFKNISPFPLPLEMPNDGLELAKMAIERITSVDRATKITVYDTETEVESEDKTWIVSGISPFQKEFLSNIPKVCMTVLPIHFSG